MFSGLALVRTLLFALLSRIRDKRAKRAHRLLIGRHSARFGKGTQNRGERGGRRGDEYACPTASAQRD